MTFLGFYPFEIDRNSLQGKIKYYRNLNGITHRNFAEIFKIHETTSASWEKGTMPLSFKLKRIGYYSTLKQINQLLWNLSIIANGIALSSAYIANTHHGQFL